MTDTANTPSEVERWLDALDPDQVEWDDTRDLAAIGYAADALTSAQASVDQARGALTAAVAAARANGRSWADIGRSLGVTRQTAHERFAEALST